MTLILIRGNKESKIVKAIHLLQLQGKLNLLNQPKYIDSYFADSVVRNVLNSKVKRKSRVAVAFFVEENESHVINIITELHPPAHVVVINKQYAEYSKLEYVMNNGRNFNKFESLRLYNGGLIDYTHNKKYREFKKIMD